MRGEGRPRNRPLFWKEQSLLCSSLKCSWIVKITFLVFSKICFFNQTTEGVFRSRDHSLKSSCCLVDATHDVSV